MELLLLSNSTLPGEPFFQWPRPYLQAFLQGRKIVGFVPYAAPEQQQDGYVEKVSTVFNECGCELRSMHREKDFAKALNEVDVIAVGGGNTFLLLRQLYRTGLVRSIPEKVKNGMPYIGWSAGSNVACPTIMTTNDMPIVEPPTLRAMHLIGFQINAHYTEAIIPNHGGESRDQRIAEYLTLNPEMTVAGLYEGSLLHAEGSKMSLHGKDMKVFRYGKDPKLIANGASFRKDLSDI
ncbi:MAG: dipeptidase PepE [Bacteroidota bacterium]|nr:dipeptidase PepE [Bacteroidota bacterium]